MPFSCGEGATHLEGERLTVLFCMPMVPLNSEAGAAEAAVTNSRELLVVFPVRQRSASPRLPSNSEAGVAGAPDTNSRELLIIFPGITNISPGIASRSPCALLVPLFGPLPRT